MKELYFTIENINIKEKEFLLNLTGGKNIRPVNFLPKESALLVLDMQDYFINPSSHACIPSAEAIIPKINNLIYAYNKANLPIIFTKHLNTSQDAKLMGSWWKDLICEDNPLSAINKQLNTINSTILTKSQYDAFFETELQEILKNNNITQIVITGVMTHLCCETTVRSAFIRGITPIFPIDTTATYNQIFHSSTFLNLTHGFTTPMLSEELFVKLEEYY